MKIQKIGPSRWQEYKKLRIEAVKDTPESFITSVSETIAEPDSGWKDKINNMFFALNDEDQLIGMAGCVREEKEKLQHIINIVSVYVSPNYRSQGVGRQLLEAAIHYSKELTGVTKIQLGVITTQIAANKLYESLGFKEAGILRQSIKVNGVYFDEKIMEMILG